MVHCVYCVRRLLCTESDFSEHVTVSIKWTCTNNVDLLVILPFYTFTVIVNSMPEDVEKSNTRIRRNIVSAVQCVSCSCYCGC